EIFWLLTAITSSISIILVIINKRFIFRKLRYKDNPTIASVSAIIGIIYGVLVGFISLYLINNQNAASEAVQHEANAAANVYLYSQWLKQPIAHNIQEDLKAYLDGVIHQEWPVMQKFQTVSQNGDFVLKKIFNDLKSFVPATSSETLILQNTLNEIRDLYNARHNRINVSNTTLSPEIWVVIIVGTILIIAINYAFRVNFYLHIFSISVFSVMAASMLFLLITLDRPFQGEFAVSADPLQAVIDLMNKTKQ
ncbi:MAG: bestrophin-like domain, partial [Gammaproteobacteria bacterium]